MNTRKAGRSCSICSHDQLQTIDRLLVHKPFRAISRHIQGDDSMRDALRRHERNCLRHALPEEEQPSQNESIPEKKTVIALNASDECLAWWEDGLRETRIA